MDLEQERDNSPLEGFVPEIRNEFNYSKGHLIRKIDGKVFGSLNKRGYLQGRISNKNWYLHRLIFLFHRGYLPKYVDHINGNRSDNRIENLRDVSCSINNANSLVPKGSNKYRGVSFNKSRNKYSAEVYKDRKKYYIGLFATAEQAQIAYIEKKKELYGDQLFDPDGTPLVDRH